MKILGTFFRFLCALIVLLAVAVYLDGPLQASLVNYFAAFTPEHIQTLAHAESWLAIAAGALLLLTLCCGLKLGWNIVYSLATLAFFAEVAIMTLGPELALPSPIRGLGWESLLRELALNYPVPALMIPSLCILGCLCTSAPVRIAWTSLLSCALCYGCAELLFYGVKLWQGMPEPILPSALELTEAFPWILAALPAVFFIQYSLFMAMFEAFIPRKKKKNKDAEKKDDAGKAADSKEPTAAAAVATAATTPAVVVKRPVIQKKSPVSSASEEKKKEEPKPEAKPEAPAEEKKEDAPAEEKPAAEEKKDEEAKEEQPAAIPSVLLPPAPNAAS